MSVYGATKSALSSWCDALRVELSKFGVRVVKFIPGSFIVQSNIMARQLDFANEMSASFSKEQQMVYGDYFKRYNNYLSFISNKKMPSKIEDPGLYATFDKALLDVFPRSQYLNEPWRYSIYHTLFKYSPVCLRDYCITKFMKMPPFKDERLSVVNSIS